MMNFREKLRKIKDERVKEYAPQAELILEELIYAIKKLNNKKLFELNVIEMRTTKDSIIFKQETEYDNLYSYLAEKPEDSVYGIKEAILKIFAEESIEYQINNKGGIITFYIS